MANKRAILKTMADYFAEKGSMLTPTEYKEADDAPVRYMVAKRPFGSWARMQSMVRSNFPDQWAKANPEEAPAPAPKAEPKKAASKKATAAPKKAEQK